MGNEGRVEAGLQGRVDLLLRVAAHQPGMRLDDVVLIDQVQIHANAFIRDDLDGVKESLKAGTLHLGGLFGGFAFGEENHPVAAGKIGKRFRHAIEHARRSVLEFGDHGSNFF